MANIRIKLDRRCKRANNSYPLVLTLHHRSTIRLSTRMSATLDEWDEAAGVFRGSSVQVKSANAKLRYMLSQAETLLLNLSISGELAKMTASELQRALERELNVSVEKGHGATIVDYLEKAKRGKSRGTQQLFHYTQQHVLHYMGNRRVQDIDERWIKGYRDALLAEKSPNTVRQDMTRLFRALTIAMDEGVITRHPGRGIKKPVARVRKKALAVEDLRELRDMTLPNAAKRRARDLFMLQFYLIGINLADLYSAVSLTSGRLEYVRHKTKVPYSIKVEPEAMALIERLKGDGALVDIPYKSHVAAVSSITGCLQRIRPGLSTNWARHTWATIAAEIGIPIETISHALGHQIGSPVTAIYIAFNQKKVDEANRRVIDYVNADIK